MQSPAVSEDSDHDGPGSPPAQRQPATVTLNPSDAGLRLGPFRNDSGST